MNEAVAAPPRPEVTAVRAALAEAHVPTLVAVVAHLSGEATWLRPPFAPRRTRGMEDNADGGLSPQAHAALVDRATELVADPEVASSLPDLDDDLLIDILSTVVGEPVPAEYAGLVRQEMDLSPRVTPWTHRPAAADGFRVLVVGAGVSGLAIGLELSRLGIEFEIIEKSSAVGGTWFDNRYPGAGVDTPSHLYSFSSARRTWRRFFAKQEEIEAYLVEVADSVGIRDRIALRTTVESATWHDEGFWRVELRDARGVPTTRDVDVVVSAVGQLNVPKTPWFPGVDTFGGRTLHAARWDPDLDVDGKSVTVIGGGATAMQLVPALAERAAHVTVLQREPHWVAPAENYLRDVPEGIQALMDTVPAYAAWYRAQLVWLFSDKIHESLHVDPEWETGQASVNKVNDAHRRFFTRYLTEQLGDRTDLVDKLTPRYPPFSKRMLLDNRWFETLRLPHVELVNTGVGHLTETAVVDDRGGVHPSDVVVYATGFDTLNMVQTLQIRGRDGHTLSEDWGDDDPRAYLGISVPHYPNFYLMYGPNTALGHGGSLIMLSQAAAAYVAQVLRAQLERGWRTVEVREDVYTDYNEQLDSALATMIWSHPQTTNWYRNKAGRVVTNSPWRIVDYWARTRCPDLADFEVTTEDVGAHP